MSKSFVRLIPAIALSLGLGACSANWGNYRKVSLDAPSDMQEVSGRVTGSTCGLSYWFFRNPANAVRDAISKAPGATGLKDVELRTKWLVGIVQCVQASGVPVK